jgi:holin-like protein
MLLAITLLLLYQLIGELLTRFLALPIPGPVIGMALLLLTFVLKPASAGHIDTTAQVLLRNLSLLFVPAGVGVITHFGLIQEHWLALGLALGVSTVLGLITTAWIMQWFMRWMQKA